MQDSRPAHLRRRGRDGGSDARAPGHAPGQGRRGGHRGAAVGIRQRRRAGRRLHGSRSRVVRLHGGRSRGKRSSGQGREVPMVRVGARGDHRQDRRLDQAHRGRRVRAPDRGGHRWPRGGRADRRGGAGDRDRRHRRRPGLDHPHASDSFRKSDGSGREPAPWRIQMSDLVTFEKQGQVGVITVNNPPVNALSQGVRQGLLDGITKGLADAGVSAMVIIGGGRTFIAGADIREFGKPPQPPGLHGVLDAIEGSSKPVVAAIHGTALGGGLEVCLACHYRVAVAAGQVGLPEVKLGLLPGAGGTQRLPRVAGVEAALKMIVSGDPVRAPRAKEMGIVDEIVGDDLRAGAVAFAERVVAEKRPLRKISDIDDKLAPARANPGMFDAFRKSIEREARGYLAPFKCIEAVQAAVTLPFAEGLKRERQLFQECMASPQSKGQIHAFFAEREATKIPDVPPGTPARKIERAAVVGAGTMGGGIAMNFANAGIPVTVVEVAQDALDRGLATIRKNYERTAQRGGITAEQVEHRAGLITGSLDMNALADVDLVIEAVFERMDIKKDIFEKLDAICKPGAILATNTSALNIDEIASVTRRPEAVIGLHFFSPANVMKLLEVVRADHTSKPIIATSMKLAKKIGKVAALVGVCPG